jgi:uncharacterized membrane protein YphA (DoxX/SURF4 family)
MMLASRLVLRWSWCLLFLWFGTQQLLNPSDWIGFLPEWTGYLPVPAEMLIQLNGWTEVIAAILLALGYFTRLMALFLAAHLAGIAVSVGGAIGVRDATLSAAGLSIALAGPDDFCLDKKLAQEKTGT